MKNLLLTVLITLSTTIFAKTPDSLFGVSINDNVLNYVTKEELKSKDKDVVSGYFWLLLKNPPVINKDYSDVLFVTFDKNNKISEIQSEKNFQNSENCETVEYGIRRTLETKYDIKFTKSSLSRYGFYHWVGYGDIVIGTECKFVGDDETTLFIYIQTEEYSYKYDEYFNSRI